MEVFYEEIENECGLKFHRSKTKVYSPNGNYEGGPLEFKIGSVTTILPNHLNG